MRFRPHFLARFPALGLGGLVVWAVVSVWEPSDSIESHLLTGAILAIVTYLTIRWVFIAGISTRDNRVTVHGAIRSRRVPRDQAIEAKKTSTWMALKWRTTRGDLRSSPLLAFTTMPSDPQFFDDYNKNVVGKINHWIQSGTYAADGDE